jgi:hypothetical protein
VGVGVREGETVCWWDVDGVAAVISGDGGVDASVEGVIAMEELEAAKVVLPGTMVELLYVTLGVVVTDSVIVMVVIPVDRVSVTTVVQTVVFAEAVTPGPWVTKMEVPVVPVEELVILVEELVAPVADDEHESLVVPLWVLTLVASWTVVDSWTVR